MKKLIIAMLLSITTTYAFQPTSEQIEQYYKDVLKHEELFKNPDVLKFILCHKTLDGHLYGVNIVQQAQDVSKKIHERFIVEFYIAQDIVKHVNKYEDPIKIIATSLDKTLIRQLYMNAH